MYLAGADLSISIKHITKELLWVVYERKGTEPRFGLAPVKYYVDKASIFMRFVV